MDVGGASIDLTFNYLHEMLRSLEARFDVQSDQTKNQGVVFHDQAFPSEQEFLSWYLPLNPSGRGMGGMIDFVSTWAFASSEQVSTAEWP